MQCCCFKCHFGGWHYTECHYLEWCWVECHSAECWYVECRYAECHYAKCRTLNISILRASMLRIGVLSDLQSVLMLNVVMPNVVAPPKWSGNQIRKLLLLLLLLLLWSLLLLLLNQLVQAKLFCLSLNKYFYFLSVKCLLVKKYLTDRHLAYTATARTYHLVIRVTLILYVSVNCQSAKWYSIK